MAVDDAFTKVLLHMDGADASTTFADESGKAWTANGNSQIDTAQSKFGGASGLFDGTGDYITTPDSDDWFFSTGDFTIDFWVRFNSIAASLGIIGQRQDAVNFFGIYWDLTAAKLYFHAIDASTWKADYNFAWTPTTNTWYHIAIVRSGTNLYMFKDGVSQALTTTTAISTNSIANLTATMDIGRAESVTINGWIDEVRISKGIARWTANFTPPTSAYALPHRGLWSFF